MCGGIPTKENTEIWDEIRFVQKVKGTKMLCVAITRIDAETDEHDFKKAYNEAKAMPEGDERTVALNRSFEMYAEYFLDQVFLNDLDGFDADYEPEGDFLSGSNFEYFYKHMAKYMGPNPDITKEERLQLIEERYGKEESDSWYCEYRCRRREGKCTCKRDISTVERMQRYQFYRKCRSKRDSAWTG
mgnify:CR=1 FL=1